MSALTLEQFRATGRDVAVLADIPECDGWEGGGRVYNGCLVIQEGEGAKWCLTIANDSWESDDLDALEAELYQWALSEGALDVVPPVFNPATDSVMDKPHEASEVIDALAAALAEAKPWLESALDDEPEDYDNHELRAVVAQVNAALALVQS